MTEGNVRRRSWSVGAGAVAAVTLLWWVTALEDADWALWRRYSTSLAIVNVSVSALMFAAAYILSSPRDRPVRTARMLLVAMSAGLALVALELPAIAFGHDYAMTLGTHENDTWLQLALGVNRYDQELIHVHQPHSRYRGRVKGNLSWIGIPNPVRYEVDVAYDKNGFRNDQDFEAVDAVVVGDSFVEGAEVPRSQTMVALLGQRLNATVANLGQSHYGPQQELAALRRYGVPLRPKVVVWFVFGGNDLRDAERYEWQQMHTAELFARKSFVERCFTRNALRALARATTPERRVASRRARAQSAEFVRRNGTRETVYLDAPEEPWTARQWELLTGTLARAQEMTSQAGTEFVVVFIPRKLRVYRGFLHASPDSVALKWVVNDLPQVLGAWCKARGIGFMDATVALREKVASGESVYLPDDVHWSATGHEVVANAIATRLLAARAAGTHRNGE